MKFSWKFFFPFITVFLQPKIGYWQIRLLFTSLTKHLITYISGPRQIGKTTYIGLLWALVRALSGQRGLYLMHDGKSLNEIVEGFVSTYSGILYTLKLIDRPFTYKQKIFRFKSGGMIRFANRRVSGMGVGVKYDFIVWDEAQKVKRQTMEEVAPTLNMSEYGAQLFLGTPPSRDDWRLYGDTPFSETRRAWMEGKADNYYEFSAQRNYESRMKLSVANLKLANPSWKHLPGGPKHFIEKKIFEERLSHLDAARQYFGVWWLPEDRRDNSPELVNEELYKVTTPHEFREPYYFVSIGMHESSDDVFVVVTNGEVQSLARTFHTKYGSLDEVVDWLTEPNRIRRIRGVRVSNVGPKSSAFVRSALAKSSNLPIEHVSEGYHATLLSMFLSGVRGERFRIVKRDRSMIGLQSFRLNYNPKTGLSSVYAESPDNIALVRAHVNAIVFGDELKKLKQYNQFGNLAILEKEQNND